MERRTFLKILSSAGIVSLVSPTFAMEVCKNKVSKSSSANISFWLYLVKR